MSTAVLERTDVDRVIEVSRSSPEQIRKVRPPADSAFGDLDFLPAPDIEAVGEMLRHRCGMPTEITMAYVWKRKGGKKQGKMKVAYCDKVSGLAKYFGGVDFVVWFAADHLSGLDYSQRQYEALIHHELLHAGVDDDLKPIVVGHDVEAFLDNITTYGSWMAELDAATVAFQQAPLFER